MRHIIAICIFILGSISFTYAVQASENEQLVETVESSKNDQELENEENSVKPETSVEVETSMVEQILDTADKLIGVRYKTSGISPSTGFDCSGFTSYVFSQHDIAIPRTSSDMYSVGEAVNRSELAPGDLVFFNTSGNGISHVGIYVGDNQFIHSSTSRGVVLTSINDPYYWSKRYVGAKRIL